MDRGLCRSAAGSEGGCTCGDAGGTRGGPPMIGPHREPLAQTGPANQVAAPRRMEATPGSEVGARRRRPAGPRAEGLRVKAPRIRTLVHRSCGDRRGWRFAPSRARYTGRRRGRPRQRPRHPPQAGIPAVTASARNSPAPGTWRWAQPRRHRQADPGRGDLRRARTASGPAVRRNSPPRSAGLRFGPGRDGFGSSTCAAGEEPEPVRRRPGWASARSGVISTVDAAVRAGVHTARRRGHPRSTPRCSPTSTSSSRATTTSTSTGCRTPTRRW